MFSDERDPAIPDHAYDPLRYCIASRPPIARQWQKQAGQNTFEGRSKILREFHRQQGVRR